MEYSDLIEKRFSARSFGEKAIEREKLDKILNAGRLAPTAKNLQPQHIYVIESDDGLAKISELYRCFGSKTVLLICAKKDASWQNPHTEHLSYEMDASIVATHMMLAAADLAIGSTWVCCFDTEKAKELFGIPENEQPLLLLPLGYPTEDCKPSERHTDRKPLSETVTYL